MKHQAKIEIEAGIPMPKVKEKQEGKTATLRLMKIGDSIIIDDARSHNGWRSCARSMGAKVCMRQLEDGRSRMWRTS